MRVLVNIASLFVVFAYNVRAISDDTVVPGAYIVEFQDGFGPSSLYDQLRSDGIAVEQRMELKYRLFNGASFRIETNDKAEDLATKIAGKDQVKAIWPVRKIQMPRVEPPSNASNGTDQIRSRSATSKRQTSGKDNYSPHIMTQVDKLRAAGFTGKGIRIGVVDTGIDYRHPALGGCFGDGCRVSYGYDLTGDDYYSASTSPEPDADPLDTCQGHGTHVAGIIMAQENELGFTGAAPDVTLGMFKVSGCPGYTTSEILVAAFNMAYEANSDIISCSAGDDSGWASDAAAVAVSRIAEAGVPVVVALGNSGGLGLWEAASPASGIQVSGIGSVDNTVLPNIMTRGSYNNGSGEFDFGWQTGTPISQVNVTLRLWAPNNATDPGYACETVPDDLPDLTDSIALLRVPSDCGVDAQAEKIAAKSGKYILYFPESDSRMYGVYVYTDGIEGVGLVSPRQAAEWIETLSSGDTVNVTITTPGSAGLFAEDLSNGPTAGYTSTFSSWGPTWEVELKPQFTAPGGGILSTWIWDQGEFMVNPGTSMSTPFVAAAFALVGQARGTLDARTLRNIIATTSQAKQWNDGTTVYDVLAPVPQQGAGLIQVFDAAQTTTILDTSGFSFNDSDHFISSRSFSIHNTGPEDVTYALGHAKAVTVYTFTPGASSLQISRSPPPTAEAWAEVSFERNSVAVPAGESVEVHFSVTPPTGLNSTLLPVYSGYITLNGTNSQSLSIPYLGVAGSMHSTPVLRSGTDGLSGVYLSSTSDHFLIPVAANRTFTIPRPGSSGSAIYPKIVVIPTVGTTQLHVDLVAIGVKESNLTTTDWLGYSILGQVPGTPLTYVPTAGYTYNFVGVLADHTTVPEGSYKFVASGLRIFGDSSKDEDWDIVESVPFNLAYLD